jgi:hypothetical protein
MTDGANFSARQHWAVTMTKPHASLDYPLDRGSGWRRVEVRYSVNEIERVGSAVFPFRRDEFPEDSITSVRAKRIYDWLMTLGRHTRSPEHFLSFLTIGQGCEVLLNVRPAFPKEPQRWQGIELRGR